jgi:hypothetical protein
MPPEEILRPEGGDYIKNLHPEAGGHHAAFGFFQGPRLQIA